MSPEAESWKRMVLGSMAPPAWLAADAPQGEVVISSRVRYARNLSGRRFPHHADREELLAIRDEVVSAAPDLNEMRDLSPAERDYVVGCRLASAAFADGGAGRSLLLDEGRTVSLMVNEEDHLRLQALTAGWSVGAAHAAARQRAGVLEGRLTYAQGAEGAYLTASPANWGRGARSSALFHLIALAHTGRLKAVLEALRSYGVVARGMFGEGSRAVGAFFQVSIPDDPAPDFIGAGDYLIAEERRARKAVGRREVLNRTNEAVEFTARSQTVHLADALRVLAWARWAAALGWEGAAASTREVDSWISIIEIESSPDPRVAARRRAAFLRERLGA